MSIGMCNIIKRKCELCGKEEIIEHTDPRFDLLNDQLSPNIQKTTESILCDECQNIMRKMVNKNDKQLQYFLIIKVIKPKGGIISFYNLGTDKSSINIASIRQRLMNTKYVTLNETMDNKLEELINKGINYDSETVFNGWISKDILVWIKSIDSNQLNCKSIVDIEL